MYIYIYIHTHIYITFFIRILNFPMHISRALWIWGISNFKHCLNLRIQISSIIWTWESKFRAFFLFFFQWTKNCFKLYSWHGHGQGHGHGWFIKYQIVTSSTQIVTSTCSELQLHAVWASPETRRFKLCACIYWGSEQVDLTVWILKLTLSYLINYPWPWPVTVIRKPYLGFRLTPLRVVGGRA